MRIGQLIRQSVKPFFSLEFFPPSNPEQLPDFYGAVEALGEKKPLFISVTYGAGGARQDNTLAITGELAKMGFATLSHLTCVGAEPQKILDYVDALKANGVGDILALRGDPPKDREWSWDGSRFMHASDLVSFLRRERPETGIGVAVYPSPHPESATFEADRARTAEKMAAGADFAISQLFFDAREYMALVDSLRQRGIDAPVVPGILPIRSMEGLKRVLSLCGANIPAKFYLELEEANKKGGVEAVREFGMRFAARLVRQLLDGGAPGIHLYTLNKSDLCRQLLEETGLA